MLKGTKDARWDKNMELSTVYNILTLNKNILEREIN